MYNASASVAVIDKNKTVLTLASKVSHHKDFTFPLVC